MCFSSWDTSLLFHIVYFGCANFEQPYLPISFHISKIEVVGQPAWIRPFEGIRFVLIATLQEFKLFHHLFSFWDTNLIPSFHCPPQTVSPLVGFLRVDVQLSPRQEQKKKDCSATTPTSGAKIHCFHFEHVLLCESSNFVGESDQDPSFTKDSEAIWRDQACILPKEVVKK